MIATHLTDLLDNKQDLSDNLTTMGQTSSVTETLAALIAKVLDIRTGVTILDYDIVSGVAQESITAGDLVKIINHSAAPSTALTLTFNEQPSFNPLDVSVSSDGLYLACVGTGSPYLKIYKLIDGVYTAITSPTLAGGVQYCGFSDNDIYLACLSRSSPYLVQVLKRTGDTFASCYSRSGSTTCTTKPAWFNDDANFVHGSNNYGQGFTQFSRSGDTFSETNGIFPTLNCGSYKMVTDVQISKNKLYAVAGCDLSSTYYFRMLKKNGSLYEFMTAPSGNFSNNAPYVVAISDDAEYIAGLGYGTADGVKIWRRNLSTDALTAVTISGDKAYGAADNTYKGFFTHDGKYLIFTSSSGAAVIVYEISGDTATKVSTYPSIAGAAGGIDLSFTGNFIAKANGSTTPKLQAYKTITDTWLNKSNGLLSDIAAASGAGIAAESGATNATIDAYQLWG